MKRTNALINLKKRTGLSDKSIQTMLGEVNTISLENLKNVDPRRLVHLDKKLYDSHYLVNYFQSLNSHASRNNLRIPHTRSPLTKKQRVNISRQARLTGHKTPSLRPKIDYTRFMPLGPSEYKTKSLKIQQFYVRLIKLVKSIFTTKSSKILDGRVFEEIIEHLSPGYFSLGGVYTFPPVTRLRADTLLISMRDVIHMLMDVIRENETVTITGETYAMVTVALHSQIKMLSNSWSVAMSEALATGMALRQDPRNPYNVVSLLKFALRHGWRPGGRHATRVMNIALHEVVRAYHQTGRTEKTSMTVIQLLIRHGFRPLEQRPFEYSISGENISAFSHLIIMYVYGAKDSLLLDSARSGIEQRRRMAETVGQTLSRTFSSPSFIQAMKAFRTPPRGRDESNSFTTSLKKLQNDLVTSLALYLPRSHRSSTGIANIHFSARGFRAMKRDLDSVYKTK